MTGLSQPHLCPLPWAGPESGWGCTSLCLHCALFPGPTSRPAACTPWPWHLGIQPPAPLGGAVRPPAPHRSSPDSLPNPRLQLECLPRTAHTAPCALSAQFLRPLKCHKNSVWGKGTTSTARELCSLCGHACMQQTPGPSAKASGICPLPFCCRHPSPGHGQPRPRLSTHGRGKPAAVTAGRTPAPLSTLPLFHGPGKTRLSQKRLRLEPSEQRDDPRKQGPEREGGARKGGCPHVELSLVTCGQRELLLGVTPPRPGSRDRNPTPLPHWSGLLQRQFPALGVLLDVGRRAGGCRRREALDQLLPGPPHSSPTPPRRHLCHLCHLPPSDPCSSCQGRPLADLDCWLLLSTQASSQMGPLPSQWKCSLSVSSMPRV